MCGWLEGAIRIFIYERKKLVHRKKRKQCFNFYWLHCEEEKRNKKRRWFVLIHNTMANQYLCAQLYCYIVQFPYKNLLQTAFLLGTSLQYDYSHFRLSGPQICSCPNPISQTTFTFALPYFLPLSNNLLPTMLAPILVNIVFLTTIDLELQSPQKCLNVQEDKKY